VLVLGFDGFVVRVRLAAFAFGAAPPGLAAFPSPPPASPPGSPAAAATGLHPNRTTIFRGFGFSAGSAGAAAAGAAAGAAGCAGGFVFRNGASSSESDADPQAMPSSQSTCSAGTCERGGTKCPSPAASVPFTSSSIAIASSRTTRAPVSSRPSESAEEASSAEDASSESSEPETSVANAFREGRNGASSPSPRASSSSLSSSSTSSSSSKTSSCVEKAVLRFLCVFAGAAARFALAPWDRSVNRRIRPRSSLVRGFATCFAVATAAASVATAGTAAVDMDGTDTAGTETITAGGGAGGIATAAAVAFVASTVGTTTPGGWGAADAPVTPGFGVSSTAS
jgi:hypothetical protein